MNKEEELLWIAISQMFKKSFSKAQTLVVNADQSVVNERTVREKATGDVFNKAFDKHRDSLVKVPKGVKLQDELIEVE